MRGRAFPSPRLNATTIVILLASAAIARALLGYRAFPSIDDFAYIPQTWAKLDPGLYPRDEILRGGLSHTPLWPPLIWILERTLGLPEGLFLLTVVLTVLSVYLLLQLLKSLGGSEFFLPLAIALSVVVIVRGVGRGGYDGLIGDAFHMQWLAITCVMGAYNAFVRERPVGSGLYLGISAWSHPMVAAHGAFCVAVAGVTDGTRGLVNTAKTGATAFLVSLPYVLTLTRKVMGEWTGGATDKASFLQDAVLFRAPHHYDLQTLPFLPSLLLGLLAIAAFPRILQRGSKRPRRYYGLLLGQGLLLLLTYLFYGPLSVGGQYWVPTWIYSLDLSRSSPLFLALGAAAVAAALPTRDEPLAPGRPRQPVDRIFTFSAMLGFGSLLLLNLEHSTWIYALLLLAAAGYAGFRRNFGTRWIRLAFISLAILATTDFFMNANLRAEPDPDSAALYSWAKLETPREALFLAPPGLEAFRFEARRSIYVDFKLFPHRIPAQAVLVRERLEEVVDHDAKALEQARGWPGVFWWDVAYAKRNPPERIASLLRSTGADFFVQDRLYLRLPPHLPAQAMPPLDAGLEVAFENDRYRVYRLAQRP